MSNNFITDIMGNGDFAIPTNDTELADASTALDNVIGTIGNLAYDRILAWVQDSGGPGGAEGVRTLNCVIEKFTWTGKECPSEAEVDTMTGTIESTLEGVHAEGTVTSIDTQYVNCFQPGTATTGWSRDSSGGFVYPSTTTDDIAIGGAISPNGKWFDDGDLVLGASAMSGTERLRVVGDARVEGKLTVTGLVDPTGYVLTEQASAPYAPGATEGVIWMDSADDKLYFTNNTTTYDLTAGAGASPWSYTNPRIYPSNSPSNDVVIIGASTSATGVLGEQYRALGDTFNARNIGFLAELSDSSTSMATWRGFAARDTGNISFDPGAIICYDVLVPIGSHGTTPSPIYGYRYPDMSGTNFAGSTAFYQAGTGELNQYMGRTGFGLSPAVPNRLVQVRDAQSDSSTTRAVRVELSSSTAGVKAGWFGVEVLSNFAGSGTLTDSRAFWADFNPTGGGAITTGTGYDTRALPSTGTSIGIWKAFHAADASAATGTIGTAFGLHIEDQASASGTGTVYGVRVEGQGGANAYGVYIGDQGGSTNNYGLWQDGTGDLSVFKGDMVIGGVTLSAAGDEHLHVVSDDTAGPDSDGITTEYLGSGSTALSNYTNYRSRMDVPSGGSIGNAYHLYCERPTPIGGSPGTITDCYGVYIESQSLANPVTNGWGIYQLGSGDINYFAGDVFRNATNALYQEHVRIRNSDTGDSQCLVVDLAGTSMTAASDWEGVRAFASVASGTMNTVTGFRVASPSVSGTVSIAYGLFISDQNVANVGTGYGVLQKGTDNINVFEGTMRVGGLNAPDGSSTLDLSAGLGALYVPVLTQAQRTGLTAQNGMIVYDITNNAFYFRENGAWVTGSALT